MASPRPVFSRRRDIARLRATLERNGYPRLLMSLLVALTGGAGFVASFLLLKAGVETVWLRYLVSIAIAYVAFLLLLYLWLNQRLGDLVDGIDAMSNLPMPRRAGHAAFEGDGQFGGGGASSSFAVTDESAVASMSSSLSESPLGGAAEVVGEADELAIPLTILLFAVAILLSSLFVIYSAPTLLAEVLLDGILAAGLYRRLRGIERRHWLETAVRRTIWPFVLTALCLALIGWGMAWYAPGTTSVGDFAQHLAR